MRPLPLVHLPPRVTALVPIITNSVIKAVHGKPPLRKNCLDRAIVHTQRLLDELKSARLVLDRPDQEDDVA